MIPETPVIPGFHPDPSVCRAGDTYFLVTSSFEYSPGVPIFSSSDLRRWTQIGHVLDRPEQLENVNARPSGGIYAPTLRHHDGRFWMITTNVTNGPGQLLVTAEDPTGAWSDPLRIPEAHGIDPDLAWDDDGRCWLSWSGELPAGQQGILQAQLDPVTGLLLTEPRVIWRGTGGQFPEGPHLHRKDGYWYLVIAEGGTERGHAVTVARASAPNGPFEPCPSNPILTARGTDCPTQSTGHADFVQLADGSWAVLFLGVRPRGSTPAWHILGRETFAARLSWYDDWPRVDAALEPEPGDVFVEALTAEGIPLSFVSPSGLPADILHHEGGQWQLSGFVGRWQEHLFTSTRAKIAAGAGLELRVDPDHRVTVQVGPQSVRAVATIGGFPIELGEVAADGAATIELRTEPPPELEGTPQHGPDVVVARVLDGRAWRELGRIDGRYFSTEVAGGFTGRLIGLVAEGRAAHIYDLVYRGSDSYSALASEGGLG
ncbi:glycoside hydrolase family 43 protein [Kribbella speibonae]|uniref:glycoside hydrolase family 43 protein n=1 Tax=Kribbella speibonae TaxID=1572660 RepID=UPI00192DF514|nr:glycoside hydrolase family 43 protein [Kribbella speibonae]